MRWDRAAGATRGGTGGVEADGRVGAGAMVAMLTAVLRAKLTYDQRYSNLMHVCCSQCLSADMPPLDASLWDACKAAIWMGPAVWVMIEIAVSEHAAACN